MAVTPYDWAPDVISPLPEGKAIFIPIQEDCPLPVCDSLDVTFPTGFSKGNFRSPRTQLMPIPESNFVLQRTLCVQSSSHHHLFRRWKKENEKKK